MNCVALLPESRDNTFNRASIINGSISMLLCFFRSLTLCRDSSFKLSQLGVVSPRLISAKVMVFCHGGRTRSKLGIFPLFFGIYVVLKKEGHKLCMLQSREWIPFTKQSGCLEYELLFWRTISEGRLNWVFPIYSDWKVACTNMGSS